MMMAKRRQRATVERTVVGNAIALEKPSVPVVEAPKVEAPVVQAEPEPVIEAPKKVSNKKSK